MTDKVSESKTVESEAPAVNEVRSAGAVVPRPEERVLPSGDAVWTLRLVVARPANARTRQSVDSLDCAVWGGRLRSTVAGGRRRGRGGWAVRRRFFRRRRAGCRGSRWR